MTGPADAARLLLRQCYGSAELQTHLTGADTGFKDITGLLRLHMPQHMYTKNSCRVPLPSGRAAE